MEVKSMLQFVESVSFLLQRRSPSEAHCKWFSPHLLLAPLCVPPVFVTPRRNSKRIFALPIHPSENDMAIC